MLSRALILATVTVLIGDLTAPAHAQVTNLEAGKSPSQIFAGTCTACHKSPRGLLRTVPAGSLPSFLRQHYTTSPEMAGLLSSYLISNGAADTRYGSQTRQEKDAKSGGKPEGKPGSPVEQLDHQGRRLHTTAMPEPARPEAEPRQAAGPDADSGNSQGEPERRGRNGKRLARPAEEGAKPAEAAEREAGERSPDGRKLKRRLSKRGRHGLEEPTNETEKDTGKADTAKTDANTDTNTNTKADTNKEEPATAGPAEDKPAGEAAKEEAAKPESAKPPGDGQSATAKTESPKEDAPKAPAAQAPALRADPASPVTSAPPDTAASSAAAPATTPESAGATAAPSTQPAAPAAPSTAPAAAAVETAPPAVSTPPAQPPPSVAPAGSPAPPASQ